MIIIRTNKIKNRFEKSDVTEAINYQSETN